MKTTIYLILFFLSIFYANAQNSIIPNSNKYTLYLDNIIIGNEVETDYSKISMVLFDNYYKEFADIVKGKKMIKEIFIEKDTTCLNNRLHIRTKKAKGGYLFINKTLSDKIKECCNDWNKIVISYVYNGKVVSTKDEVRKILKLKVKRTQILSIKQNKDTKIVTIYFSDK